MRRMPILVLGGVLLALAPGNSDAFRLSRYDPDPTSGALTEPHWWALSVDGGHNFIHWDLRRFPDCRIAWCAHDGTGDLPELSEFDEVSAAFSSWEDIRPARITFERVLAGGGGAPLTLDGENKIGWGDLPDGVLGIAATWSLAATGEIFEADILFNNIFYIWVIGAHNLALRQVDVQSIAVHEIGHLVGLHHTEVNGPAGSLPTMWWAVDPFDGTLEQRSLEQDDRQGTNFLCTPDLGDAPDPSYPSLVHGPAPGLGAQHTLGTKSEHLPAGGYLYEWLGTSVGGECESRQINVDTHDDGVLFQFVGRTLWMDVAVATAIDAAGNAHDYASHRLYLNAWIDWNRDGDWADGQEWVLGPFLDVSPPVAGQNLVHTFAIDPPAQAAEDSVWVRVRLDWGEDCGLASFLDPGLVAYEGAAQFGEVEDYLLCSAEAVPRLLIPDYRLYQDAFGQFSPLFADPGDRGNANSAWDLSGDVAEWNDWLADSIVITGPIVRPGTEWLPRLHFRIARLGARQRMIPEYFAWKARLPGDPEAGFVAAVMDSAEPRIWPNTFATYFHESDPAFAGQPDCTDGQEILPDGVFVPGTRIEYFFDAYYVAGGPGAVFYTSDVYEFEVLPNMQLVPGSEYTVQAPAVLFIDAGDRPGEDLISRALAQTGVSFDRYDYLGAMSSESASLLRSWGLDHYNPGGYGNNGCTLEQLLMYRMIVLDSGTYGVGALKPGDADLLAEWLTATECGLSEIRKALVVSGENSAEILESLSPELLPEVLGTALVAPCYRDYNADDGPCVNLEPAFGEFAPLGPVALHGNWASCFDIVQPQPGRPTEGNLNYVCATGDCNCERIAYAQVVSNDNAPADKRLSIVNGFALDQLTAAECEGSHCSSADTCVIQGIAALLGGAIPWLTENATPFDPWFYPCTDTRVDDEAQQGLELAADFLYGVFPNPHAGEVEIRFNLARPSQVSIRALDVTGRLVASLVEDRLAAGFHRYRWNPPGASLDEVGSGIFWLRMETSGGYRSTMRLVRVR